MRPAVALSRHPDAAGTAAALLGAAQFGLGAVVAPVVGVLGNDEVALSTVMTIGVVVALLALLAVGASRGADGRAATPQLVAAGGHSVASPAIPGESSPVESSDSRCLRH